MVIADTSIWIHAQRQPDAVDSREFWRLYDGREIAMAGPVLAELLHGLQAGREFDRLVGQFEALDYLEVDRQTWTLVGRIRRELRRRGELVGSPIASRPRWPYSMIAPSTRSTVISNASPACASTAGRMRMIEE